MVIYDRLQNRKIYFEIAALFEFLMRNFKMGISNENKGKKTPLISKYIFFCSIPYHIVYNPLGVLYANISEYVLCLDIFSCSKLNKTKQIGRLVCVSRWYIPFGNYNMKNCVSTLKFSHSNAGALADSSTLKCRLAT